MLYKKGIILLIMLLLLLTGCSEEPREPNENEEVAAADEEETESDSDTETETEEDKPTQEELNAKMKEEAIELNFSDINNHRVDLNQKVFGEGKVGVILSEGVTGEFSLEVGEDSKEGIYAVFNASLVEVKVGDKIKIWGIYDGTHEETGAPQINATIIEHVD